VELERQLGGDPGVQALLEGERDPEADALAALDVQGAESLRKAEVHAGAA
jgi:hypothetical protein